MSEIEIVMDTEYREAGDCCPTGTSELEVLCSIFFFFLYSKALHGKNTGDRRGDRRELPAAPQPLKTFYPYPNFQKSSSS